MPTAQNILDRKGSDVATIGKSCNVLEAATLMNQKHIGALVVRDGDRIVGIFTERDILNRVVAKEAVPHETIVGDVMTSPMAVCRRDTRLGISGDRKGEATDRRRCRVSPYSIRRCDEVARKPQIQGCTRTRR